MGDQHSKNFIWIQKMFIVEISCVIRTQLYINYDKLNICRKTAMTADVFAKEKCGAHQYGFKT